MRTYCSLLTDSPVHFLSPNPYCNSVSAKASPRGSKRLLRTFLASPSFCLEKALTQKQDFRCVKGMAMQGEIHEGEISSSSSEGVPYQGAPHVPRGAQQGGQALGSQ